MSRPPLAALAAAVALLVPAAPAAAQGPAPLGHACTPEDGVRVCPTTGLDDRVPSFDGTPLDVDVTLPPRGDGPFPTLLLLHGLGGTKTSFLKPSPTNPGYDARSFARAGYAVVTPTARGYGNSCGRPESRTAGCENGFVRLADMRYEVRDVQTLTGILVDQGIARPDAIGATGVSYGGGMSTMLAFLKNRIRLEDGNYAPWTSPNGTPISLAAAWPRWLWSNGEGIFIRNGRGTWARNPTGVPTPAYAGGIFLTAFTGFVAPEGVGGITADIRGWKAQLDRGTLGPEIEATLDLAYSLHGVAGMTGARYPAGGPAPLLMQSGWTDALFPVGHSIAAYEEIRSRDPQAPIALQFGDLGHAPAANNVADTVLHNAQGAAFLDARLRGIGTGPPPGLVTAITMRCPAGRGGTAYHAPSLDALTQRTIRFGRRRAVTITHRGASDRLAAELNPLGSRASPCTLRSPDRSNRRNTFSTRTRGITLLGRPVITGRARVFGRYGQVIARLWDLDPRTNRQRLITRGAYRFLRNQRGRFRFVLDGNGWRFERGHRIVVELVGRDEPTYDAAPEPFRATLSRLRVALPAR